MKSLYYDWPGNTDIEVIEYFDNLRLKTNWQDKKFELDCIVNSIICKINNLVIDNKNLKIGINNLEDKIEELQEEMGDIRDY